MKNERLKAIKIIVGSFISVTMVLAIISQQIYLGFASVLIGVLFWRLVQKRSKNIVVDERVMIVAGKASRLTFVISTVLSALLSVFLIASGSGSGQIDLEAVGTILSFVAMFNLGLYAMSYKYVEKKYGADEK